MAELDPHMFFSLQQSSYLDRLSYEPRAVLVLEVLNVDVSLIDGRRETH
jgi:hypothetical protein